MVLDPENLSRIKNALRFKPKGMSITDISRHLRMNRNSVAKYLEILLRSGEAESRQSGSSRIYTVSQRVPASAMMRFSSEMIVMIDEKGMVLKANDPFSTFSGIPHEALVGQNITSIPDELIQDLPVSSYLGESEEQQVRTLFRNIWRNGSDCYFRIKVVPTIFDSGSRGFTIIIEDISDQKRAENALAERQQLYQDVIKNIQDVFYRTDPDGNLIMASPSWAHLLGYDSVDECLGCNIARDFYMDPEKRRLLLDAIDRDGLVKDFEVV